MSEHLQSIDAEQSVLAAVLVRPEAIHEISGFLDAGHFYEPVHAEMYGAIRKLASEGRAVTPITLAPFFQNAEPIGDMTVIQYVGKVMASVTSLISIKDHAAIVKEFADRRQIAGAGMRLQQLAGDHLANVSQIASDAVQDLDTVISASRPARLSRLSLEASARVLLDNLEKGDAPKPITTGLRDLDRIIGGWRRGEYSVVAARPSMGKSAFAAAAMLNAARAGHGVMMFSLEMTKDALAARCLSDVVWNRDAPIRYADILNERVDSYQRDRLRRAAEAFAALPIVIEDQGGLTISEIAAKARQQASRFERDGLKLDLVIIDHLGIVRASKRYAGDKVNETGEVSNGLATLAKDLGAAMLALHQLNRQVEGRDDKHPQLSDLRNSGDIEQDADMIGFLYRPGYYLERMKFDDEDKEELRRQKLENKRHDFEIIVAKQRNGPCLTIDLFAEMSSNVIRCKA